MAGFDTVPVEKHCVSRIHIAAEAAKAAAVMVGSDAAMPVVPPCEASRVLVVALPKLRMVRG